MAKAEYRPNPSPHWVKDTMIEDYLGVAHRNGESPSASDVERLAISDLGIAEAVMRHSKRSAPRKAPDPMAKPNEVVKDLAAGLGFDVTKRPLAPRKKARFNGFMDKPPANQKQAAAIMRLGEILKPASMFRPSKEFDYTIPRLAQRFAEAMQRLDLGTGEFAGQGKEECERIVWRLIEDICDQSVSRMGGWWVPK